MSNSLHINYFRMSLKKVGEKLFIRHAINFINTVKDLYAVKILLDLAITLTIYELVSNDETCYVC
jgi:hypothetical protein